ncbi:MAG: hypothetical protein WCO35_00040 [Candidatus Nomurabacteria bacterium]
MFKKFYSSLFILGIFFILSVGHSFALVNKVCNPGTYTASEKCSGQVIVANDFKGDTINVLATDDAGDSETFYADYHDGAGSVPVSGAIPVVTGGGSIGTSTTYFNHDWASMSLPLPILPKTYQIDIKAQDGSGAFSAPVTYNMNLDYAPITLTNDISLSNNGNVLYKTVMNFTCTNTTDMTYDGTLVGSYAWYSGTKFSYKAINNDATTTTHTVVCKNIGGTVNQQVFTYTTGPATTTMTGTISASPAACTIALGASSCTTSLTWSITNPVSTSAVTSDTDKYGTSAPNTSIGGGNSNTLASVTIPYSSRNFYLYNNAQSLDQVTVNSDCGSNIWEASTSKCVLKTTTVTCPDGSVHNAPYTCPKTVTCSDGSVHNAPYTCPTTVTCSDGSTHNAPYTCSINSTSTNPNVPPSCSFTDNTYNFVKCTGSCSDGSIPSIFVLLDGTKTQVDTTVFPWASNQYQYSFVCPTGTTLYGLNTDSQSLPFIKRPYTHFVTFDVSAGYVRKGSEINLSWIVQEPTSTCKIIGTDIKSGLTLFDSTDVTNNGKINTSLTKAMHTNGQGMFGISTDNYSHLMGSYYRINSSTRFTASCVNDLKSTYKPGPNQLIRDVYVTGETQQ